MLAYALVFVALALTGSATDMWLTIPLIMLVASFAVLYLMSKLVGEVYQFGAGTGCMVIFVGGVLLAVLAALGNWALASLLGRMLGGLS